MMQILLALLIALTVACESKKENLPGTYKLEKTKEEIQEDSKQYSMRNSNVTPDKTGIEFTVAESSNWQGDGVYKGVFTLLPITKNEKSFITLKTTIGETELTQTMPFSKEPTNVQELSFIYKDLKFSCAYVCRDPECKTLAFSPRFERQTDKGNKQRMIYSTIWNLTLSGPENDSSYKITNAQYIQGDQKFYEDLYKDPLLILKIPADSKEIKSWATF